MKTFRGVGIGSAVAYGTVVRMPEPLAEPRDVPSTRSAEEEEAEVRAALSAVARDLEQRSARTDGPAGDILEAQAMMAEDPALIDEIVARLADGKTGEWAVHDAFASFRDTLVQAGGYLAERAADLDDVARRIVARLRGVPAPSVPDPGHPFVLVATDLAPADTALLDLEKVLALVTAEGGPTSHTAILARARSIAAVVGAADAATLAEGQTVIVDAAAGAVTADPTETALQAARLRAAERAAAATAPVTPGALKDGAPVPLLANLGRPDEAAAAIAQGAEGVGLFRTEFLFLSAPSAPTIDAQRTAYTALLTAFPHRKVVVRMLDAGADKPLPFLTDAHEENPALGVRGLRALRAHEHVLRDQLTALAQAAASTDADVYVMAPMVATLEETEYFCALAHRAGLGAAGIMIEVPSAALLADRILTACDFVSLGTNDLTQYTMAADRLLGKVASLQDPWHPAVLRLIHGVGAAGRAHGKPVSVCGEAAADPLLAVVLVGLGATSLSMAPTALADVRAALREHTRDDAERMAAAALAAVDGPSARRAAEAAA